MLCLSGGQVESLFDLGLPVAVAELPADLAGLDALLAEPGPLAPIEAAWAEDALWFRRPTVPMDRFLRLMVVEARSGWGYEIAGAGGLGFAALAALLPHLVV